jgi:hypothetical protein
VILDDFGFLILFYFNFNFFFFFCLMSFGHFCCGPNGFFFLNDVWVDLERISWVDDENSGFL